MAAPPLPTVAGLPYLTEGGQETEVMYKHGFDLPEFAMYPLLDQPEAVAVLEAMYAAVLDVASRHGWGLVLGGLDYRASPDWAGLLGLDAAGLESAERRCIDFLRGVVAAHGSTLPSVLLAGVVGPRGDAYAADVHMGVDESAEYHAVQVATLAQAGVDLVEAMTFNDVPEAVGLARAAAAHGLPLTVSFTLGADGRLQTGPTIGEAIAAVDAEAGDDRPAAYGINCSHPLEFLPALDEPGGWIERVRVLRPNAVAAEKAALCTLGHLESGDPADLGRHMGALARRFPHVDIWGGCCGTWDEHLDAIATEVGAARA